MDSLKYDDASEADLDRWLRTAAAVAELREDGLAYVQIGGRLGITTEMVKTAVRIANRPAHGVPARWYSGCRCGACSEAIRKDPVVIQAGILRGKGLTYRDIAEELGIPSSQAEKACLAAGVQKGIAHGVPARWNAGCRCDTCVEAMRKDPLVIKIGELRNSGLKIKEIAARLGISIHKAEQVSRQVAPLPEELVCAWTFCRRLAVDSTFCPRHAAIVSRAGSRKTPKHIMPTGREWDELVTAAGDLFREGLTYAAIGRHLEVTTGIATRACQAAVLLIAEHGTEVQWHAGCRCDACIEAMCSDPLITAVAGLRNEGLKYKDVAGRLGISMAKARRAGKEASACGLIEGRQSAKTGSRQCSWYECGSPAGDTEYCLFHEERASRGIPLDAPLTLSDEPDDPAAPGFTPKAWAELVVAVGELRESGLRDAAIGRRLGVSTRVVKTAGNDAGPVDTNNGHAGDDAGVHLEDQRADPTTLSEVSLHEDGVGWIPLDTYVQMTAQEDVTPEVRVRTPEEWADLVRTVGELRQAGLTIKKISLRLGIPPKTASDACEESSFDGTPDRPAHGTRTRWRTGCSCVLCTEGKDVDPLIAEVRRLRGERKAYPEIGRILGVSPARAWQAGKDAGFTGLPERPADEPSASEKEAARRVEDRARASAHSQPWTAADEQAVMDSDLPPKELAAVLGRTPAAIQNKRRELTANAAKPRAKRRHWWWSQEDDETVMRDDLTPLEKADRLGCSISSVHHRRYLLRTGRTPKRAEVAADQPAERKRRPWTPEDLATAKRQDLPVRELAAMLGRTPGSVYSIRHRA